MPIGQCDACGSTHVPGLSGEACGVEGFFCHICRGDVFDPYGEVSSHERADRASACGCAAIAAAIPLMLVVALCLAHRCLKPLLWN